LEGDEPTGAMYPGEGWVGCAVGISLAVRFAIINFSRHSRYEDGSMSIPDVESVIFSTKTNERVDTTTHYRENLDPRAFQKLEKLRGKIAAVLLQHRIRVLDESVLDTRAGAPSRRGCLPPGAVECTGCVLLSWRMTGADAG